MTPGARRRPAGEPSLTTPRDRRGRWSGAEQQWDSLADGEQERSRILDSLSGMPGTLIGPNLWSAPTSGVPVDADLLDVAQAGPWQDPAAPAPQPPVGDPGVVPSAVPSGGNGCAESSAARSRGWRGSSGVALVIAITILLGLGMAARWLEAQTAAGEGPSTSRQPVTGGNPGLPAPSVIPSPPAPRPARSADAVITGPSDCPMRVRPERSSSGQNSCFFIG